MVSRCLRSLIGRSSEQQQLDWEMWGCQLDTRRFWRKTIGFYLARLHCLISLLDFFMSPSETVASPPVLLDTGDDDQDDLPTVQEKVLTSSSFCHFIYQGVWEHWLEGAAVDWKVWTDWRWYQGVWGHWLEEVASSNSWTGKCEVVCWIRRDSEGKQEVPVWLDFIAWFLRVNFRDCCIATSTAGHWGW